MHSEPRDLDHEALRNALSRYWDIDAAGLEYLPVGFGSHHWQAMAGDGSRWFVSVDDLQKRHGRDVDDGFAQLDRAFRTAVVLREQAGMRFVLAPISSDTGAVLRRIGGRYTIRVEPFVDGAALGSGDYDAPGDRRMMGTLLGCLHAASASVPPDLPGREDFALPGRAALEQALAELDTPWRYGPYGEPARKLLRAHADRIRERLVAYDRLAERALTGQAGWVVTHGEPHSANVIRDLEGGLRLVDWDTTLVGPRERDLWTVLDDDLTGWAQYREEAGSVPLQDDALLLYRQRWPLAEICEYVGMFRRPHEDASDTQASWRELSEYMD